MLFDEGDTTALAMDAATARALVGGGGGELDYSYSAGLIALKAHLAAQPRSPQETALIHWYAAFVVEGRGGGSRASPGHVTARDCPPRRRPGCAR